MVPNALIRSELPVESKMCLIALLSHDWETNPPSNARIADEIRISPRSMRRHLASLRSVGCVKGGINGGRYRIDLTALGARYEPPGTTDKCDAMSVGSVKPSEEMRPPVAASPKIANNISTTGSNAVVKLDVEDTRSLLASAGINDPTRTVLANKFPFEYVRRHLEWMRYRNGVRDAAAALVASLLEDWGEPTAAKSAREELAQTADAQRRAVAATRVAALTIDQSTVDEWKWLLPPVRYQYEDRARNELGGRFGTELHGRDFEAMVSVFALHLLQEELRAKPQVPQK